MADLNFPNDPTAGTEHQIGSTTWTWTGRAWIKSISPNKRIDSIEITSKNNATTSTNGVLVVAGGAGIAKDLWVGGNLHLLGTLYQSGDKVLTTATFSGVTKAGDDIQITTDSDTGSLTFDNISTFQTVTNRGSSSTQLVSFTNTTTSYSYLTGAVTVSGGVGIGGDLYVQGRVNSESIRITDSILDSTAVSINNTDITIIDSYSIDQFRSAKYLIQISETSAGNTAKFQMIEILLLVDNIGTVYATEYGQVASAGSLGEFAADMQPDSIVRLYFTSTSVSNKTIKVLRTAMST
jgi:hypothetical protein